MSVRVAGALQTTQALAPREETLLGHRRELSAYVRERLAEIGTARSWRKGSVILRAGEVPPFVLVIELGQLRYSRLGRRGAKDLMSLPEDALIGLPSVVAQRPLRFNILAAEMCMTTVYNSHEFLTLMEEGGRVTRELSAMLARGVLNWQDHTQEAREKPLIERVHAELHHMKSTGQGKRVDNGFALRLSQYDLACLVGSSREAVNRLLKQLEQQGMVRLGYLSIVLLDTELPASTPSASAGRVPLET